MKLTDIIKNGVIEEIYWDKIKEYLERLAKAGNVSHYTYKIMGEGRIERIYIRYSGGEEICFEYHRNNMLEGRTLLIKHRPNGYVIARMRIFDRPSVVDENLSSTISKLLENILEIGVSYSNK